MAEYYRRERTTRRVEFVVPTPDPWGACWVEVAKAISAARQEMEVAGLIKEGATPSDDAIRIRPGDEDVVVSYEFETRAGEGR